MAYPSQTGNSIGNLLRFIQEQKSQSPIVPPTAQPGSPIRETVQQPLSGEEGRGTSKVVSVRPEGTLTPKGTPIEQGAPQSSRIGPISIGGADVGNILNTPGEDGSAPPSVVAANEPGSGFSIPSATRTTGDVLNKTGAASGQGPGITKEADLPSLGTRIKYTIPETAKGQQVQDYTFARDKQNADIRSQEIKAAMEAGDKSSAETASRLEATDKAYKEFEAEKAKNEAIDKAYPSLIAYAENPTPENRAAYMSNKPQESQGQVMGTTAVSTPGLKYYNPPKEQPVYSKPQPVNIPKAVQSGGLTVQKSTPQPKAPSIGTILGGGALQALKKLFGW